MKSFLACWRLGKAEVTNDDFATGMSCWYQVPGTQLLSLEVVWEAPVLRAAAVLPKAALAVGCPYRTEMDARERLAKYSTDDNSCVVQLSSIHLLRY